MEGDGRKNKGDDPAFIIVGRVLSPWGVGGEVKVEVLTDFPERFDPGSQVYLLGKEYEVQKSRPGKNFVIVKLARVDSRDDAEALAGRYLEVPRDQLHSLPEGEYYPFQIQGLEVWTTQGECWGEVVEVLRGQGNDVLVLRPANGGGRETLVPVIEEVIKEVDLERGRIIIEPLVGMRE
ncbi:MAG: 16S rRNA processing protein RimM [Chloroflexi bacterium]|nr:16S rRNA processing protein RimM [Chloroflexota bacterium]